MEQLWLTASGYQIVIFDSFEKKKKKAFVVGSDNIKKYELFVKILIES